ncbi:MAG: GTP cyclohydrolase II [Simkaniaceae bacterium]|nr:GTP cyclohydrolase II [Simkaniaceae bacterium]
MLTRLIHADAELNTKFGMFNIRVYEDIPGKETVVLWTNKLSVDQAPLVRVHSECLTGDVLGSRHCDCGEQLEKALKMIAIEGGVLVYLRQEGRGIGLFEKIKAYKLQQEGYDTFEANTKLGHLPDARTYEMVKEVLDDLDINEIRLISNNPSKITEITKLGVRVVERVPSNIKENNHNRKYLETKYNKFQHFRDANLERYSFQCHVETPEQVFMIAEQTRNYTKDPLLDVCIGVTANNQIFYDIDKLAQIKLIYSNCSQVDFIPVLHFSFLNCDDVCNVVLLIKEHFSFFKHIHLNDLILIKTEYLLELVNYFSVYLPLSNSNFEIVNSDLFRSVIKKHEISIVIDNSKGKGLQESIEEYKQKIDILLESGINKITLCGGFGPDSLATYFELRKYYKINFSIDAESKLKTHGVVDLQKTQRYLHQLFRFDEPKIDGVVQTRELLSQRKKNSSDTVNIQGNTFIISKDVFHPGLFPSTAWFASVVKKYCIGTKNFCEVGCGSGVISCLLALSNPKLQIVATDLCLAASNNTRINAEQLGVLDQIAVMNGDVLESLPKHNQFDYIFWALPFGFLYPGDQIELQERQVFDPGYKSIRKFFITAKLYLKKEGRILIGFSQDLGHGELLQEIAMECGLQLRVVNSTILKETDKVKFDLIEGKYQ